MELLFPLLILLLFIPLFLTNRRQKRQMQEMQQMQAALEAGDVVMTTSGLRGTIVDASYEDTIDIEIADGVVTTWIRGAVREKVKSEDAADTASDASSDDASDGTSSDDTAADAAPSLEKSSLEKSTVEKDESSNGTARS
jgi:preprotein translocase subunit YajC